MKRVTSLHRASAILAGVGTGLALIGTACSPSGAATDNQSAPASAAPVSSQSVAVFAAKPCADDNLHRSRCMIELILDDLEQEYGGIDGGGISQIKGVTSTSFAVSMPFEERVVTWTYEFKLRPGSVAIKSKASITKSYR